MIFHFGVEDDASIELGSISTAQFVIDGHFEYIFIAG